MKNRSIGTEQEGKSSAGKRRTRKLSSSKKRGNRSTKQILERVSIFDELDDFITKERGLASEESFIVPDFPDSLTTLEAELAPSAAEEAECSATTLAFPAEQLPGIKETEKIQRRRQIDPTTCERDYNDAEIEFMNALDTYKRSSGRMFPTCSEILEVLLSLGYRKTGQVESVEPEAEQVPEKLPPSTPTFVSCDDYREPLVIF